MKSFDRASSPRSCSSRGSTPWAQLRQIGVEAVGVLPRGYADWRRHAAEAPWSWAARAAPAGGRGRRPAAHGDRGQPADGPPPARGAREEELEDVLELVTMGRLGIEVWCYNWMAVVPWSRTSTALPTRGGATATGFDVATWDDAPDAPEAPVAEELLGDARVVPRAGRPGGGGGGRRLALHPDDPPLSPLRGIGRIVRSLARPRLRAPTEPRERDDDVPGERRAHDGRPSRRHPTLRGRRADPLRPLPRRPGTPERFVETFVDDGPTDMAACIRAYLESGVDAPIRTDHSPALTATAGRSPGIRPWRASTPSGTCRGCSPQRRRVGRLTQNTPA